MDSLTTIRLIRPGERASLREDAGIRQDGPNEIGKKRFIRGEPYIAKMFEADLINPAHDLILVAPSPICRDTLRAFFAHSHVVATYGAIREEPRIHTGDAQEKWSALVAGFAKAGDITTLADIERAENLAGKDCASLDGFLHREGDKILRFIVEEGAKLPPESSLMCIMNSPVIEAVWLALWRNSPAVFREARPLDSLAVLDNLDGIAFGIRAGKITYAYIYRHEDQIRIKIEDNLAREQIKRSLR